MEENTRDNRDLIEQMVRLMVVLHRYQTLHFRFYGPFGSPHRGQGRVLSLLKMKPVISQKELAYLMDMRNQSLGELLGKLERSGYLTRTPSPEDRRAMIIRLTDEGREAANNLDDKGTELDRLFDCLDEQEQQNLADYLDRLTTSLEQKLPEGCAQYGPMGPMPGHFHEHLHGRARGDMRGWWPGREGTDPREKE